MAQVTRWLCLSALFWWLSMPSTAQSWQPVEFASAFVWPYMLVRAALSTDKCWRCALIAWGIFLIPWLIMLAWVREVSVAGWPALSVYSASWAALTVLGVAALARARGLARVPLPLVAALWFTALEYLRAEVIFDAWPFYLTAHPMIGTHLVHAASIGGVWLVSFFVVFLSVSLVSVGRGRTGFLLPLVAAGLWLLPSLFYASGSSEATPLRVLAVQTNLPQNNKLQWTPEQQHVDVSGFVEHTLHALDEEGPVDLVIWPETMVPGLGFDVDTRKKLESFGPGAAHLHLWPRTIEKLAKETQTPWLVGSPTWVEVKLADTGSLDAMFQFNSAVLVDPDGTHQRYDKIFLTPFGETMPWIRAWPWLEDRLMALGAAGMAFSLSPGDKPKQLSVDGNWELAVPICFEDTVPSVVRRLAVTDGQTTADLIVNLSNDGWFGDDDAARRAHEAAAVFRAVELRRPLLRVVNTGCTSLISPSGQVMLSLPARDPIAVPLSIPRAAQVTTKYARWGNWFAWLCVGLSAVGIVVRVVRGPLRPMNESMEYSTEQVA